ncbi:uncharacterized protein LOC113205172 isoform X2 [Frankliniella occidentalis]|uniref:Uncharacterized protein LOC113205172 isoform X2 n=1 Tax=Frankliniella occidentalis TaxID=133901 RepID=A0A6J1S720_FRAOC|nr:uncharacterized protein LOC113205172 isoform X2 [Frankliniella occidentalis]
MAPVRHLLLCLFLCDGLPRHYGSNSRLKKGRVSVLEIRDVRICPEKSALAWMNVTPILFGKTQQTFFEGIALFDRTATSWSEMSVKFTKCRGGVSSNNCEYKSTWSRKNNVCAEFASPLTPWYSLLSTVKPPWTCPTKAGIYDFHNTTLDASVFTALAGKYVSPDVTWLVRALVKDQDRNLFMCVDIIARILPSARKSRS